MCNLAKKQTAYQTVCDIAVEVAMEKIQEHLGQWVTPTLHAIVNELFHTIQSADMQQIGAQELSVANLRAMAVDALLDNVRSWADNTAIIPRNELF